MTEKCGAPSCPHCQRDPRIKVYIASRYEDRADALALKKYLEDNNFIVVAGWLLPQDDNQPMVAIKHDTKLCNVIGQRAVKDIDDCDVLVAMSPKKAHGNGTGGRHVELGIAIGLGRGTIVFGERENVFHHRSATLLVTEQPDLLNAIPFAYASRNDFAKRFGEIMGV